jgi:hypothetical protein
MEENTANRPAPLYRRPGRPGVEQTDVDRAADELLRAGERPSIEKVRARTGGSPNTVAPLLDKWWGRLATRVAVGPGAFERLPGSLAQIAEAFYLQALDEARKTATQEEKRTRDALSHTQQDLEVRSHVLSLREKELQRLIDDRDRRLAEGEVQLREATLYVRKLQASKDAAETRSRVLLEELTKERERPRRSPAKPRHVAAARAVPRKTKQKTPASGPRRKPTARRPLSRRAPTRKLRR